MITAQGDIQVEVVADGVSVFSGWIGTGQSSQLFWGSSFQVATSNGALTLFTNDCGEPPFYMGTEMNAIYSLNPQPCS